jgi:hypothetical protein
MAPTRRSARASNSKSSSPGTLYKRIPSSASPSPADPASGPTSKPAANGGAVQHKNGFYNDEEVWIEIYYTLLSEAVSNNAGFLPPPTTEILLCFNAFFQGYMEPIGTMPNARGKVQRGKKSYADFNNYILTNHMSLLQGNGTTLTVDHELNNGRFYRPVITPALLQDVLSGSRSIEDLTEEDAPPLDDKTWIQKAADRLKSREDQFVYTADDHRHADSLNIMACEDDELVWDPEGLIDGTRKAHQMVSREGDAAAANGLLFACAVPPLGFFGDLRTLANDDFNDDFDADVVRDARSQMLTAQERRLQMNQQENQWVEQERRHHEENVGCMAARVTPARSIYERLDSNWDAEQKNPDKKAMDVSPISERTDEIVAELSSGGDITDTPIVDAEDSDDPEDADYDMDAHL